MLKRIIVGLAVVCAIITGSIMVQPVLADGICDEYKDDPDLYVAAGCDTSVATADEFANNLIKVVLSLVGTIAIVVIIYGGVQYIISIGDPGKIQRAKHAIMYGIIGLVVCLLAYAIVLFITRVVK